MKKFIILLFGILLVSCTKKTEIIEPDITDNTEDKGESIMDLEKLDVTLSTEYDGLYVRWNEIEDPSLIYKVTVEDKDGNDLAFMHETGHGIVGFDLLGYAAQENEYYDTVRFRVEAMKRGSNEVLVSGTSPDLEVTDFFPKETELEISDQAIRSFSYSSSKSTMVYGSYKEGMQNFDLYAKDEVKIYGSYVKDGRLKEFDKKLSDEKWKKLETMLRKGRLVRKSVDDPELIVMDADSPETIRMVLDDMSRLETRWFVYEPEDKEALLNMLMEICK